MDRIKKVIILALSVALVSQLYVNLFTNDFRISLSVVIFSILLLLYKDINIISASFLTGLVVFIFRVFIVYISGWNLHDAIVSNYPAIFFYSIYGICFHFLNLRKEVNMYKLYFGVLTCDFLSNSIELLLRVETLFDANLFNMIKILFIVALARASFVILFISVIRYYKLLIIKEEHEERYRKLILLTSSLKSEIYFMKKNIDYIENVMTNSYKLYEKISKGMSEKDLRSLALSIAKDVHEVKKDYIRVIRGIEELTENKIEYSDMSLKDVFYILEESTKKFIESEGLDINLIFKNSSNFRTKEHYHLISILRNLVNNSIEAIGNNSANGTIIVSHYSDDYNHIFKIYDNGKGIKEKDIKYIFEPGFSTKYNSETGFINRGFGLTLVKDITETYFRGKIHVQSTYNVGTIFEIILPKNKLEVRD